jgi:2-polyprenyl-3-methyl-5-hydroxy-6-metoxy-1,4-benzoquinol methylase
MTDPGPLPLGCPTCRHPVDVERLVCSQGHSFRMRDGVLSLLDASFARRLERFTATLERHRADSGKRLPDPAVYEDLPFTPGLRSRLEWRLRRYDWAVVARFVGTRPKRVLDIGAWNGWLSHRLACLGHEVTAIDYFADPFDGLGARRHYSSRWQAVQMDLTDLSPLPSAFDHVIVNRCLAFQRDPAAYVARARAKLAPGGSVLLTGLAFHHAPARKANAVAEMTRKYRERYGVEMFLNPTRGYLDGTDRRRLAATGVRLTPYPRLLLANLKARVLPHHPRYSYGRIGCDRSGGVGSDR